MTKRALAAFSVAALFVVLAGCSKQPSSQSESAASPEPSIATAAATDAGAPSETTLPSAATSAPASGPSSRDASVEPSAESGAPASAAMSGGLTAALRPVSFTDISGLYAERSIHDLAVLGVFGTTNGPFHPLDPVTRGAFVTWLVKANNAIYQADPQKTIRLAESTDVSFPDVPPSNPNYKYVQGMNDAGFAVGFGDKAFRPDAPLNREQMVALKVGVDAGQVPHRSASDMNSEWTYVPAWTDKEQIEKKYRDAFVEAYYSQDKYGNVGRVWGPLKTFHPLKNVTRAEAAVCLSAFWPHDTYPSGQPDTAAKAVAELAKATSTP